MRARVMMVREGRRRKPVIVNCPSDVMRVLGAEVRRLDREHFWRIDLDAKNEVLDYEVVSMGTLTASLVHPREVFKGAILSNASGIIVSHNHPSGDPKPSQDDKQTTRRLAEAGKLLGIPLLDHVVLAEHRFFSFRERGLLG